MRFYIDTAIWRDFHEDRIDKFRPLGEWAFELFRRIRENHEKVIYSSIIIDELSKDFDEADIKKIFEIISKEELLEKVEISREQVIEASKLSKQLKIPFGDCLHAIIARDNNAVMVTRDKHFEQLEHIVEVKKPEDLI